jgi:hypothetical protein
MDNQVVELPNFGGGRCSHFEQMDVIDIVECDDGEVYGTVIIYNEPATVLRVASPDGDFWTYDA